MKPFTKLALVGAALVFSNYSHAALQCSIPAGVLLNFGVYDDSSPSTKDVSTTFTVNCCRQGGANPATGTIAIAIGVSANSGQINTRQMKNLANSDLMSYQLYITSFGGTVWGNGVNGGSAFTQNVSANRTCGAGGVSVAVGSAIFGRIFAQQPVSAGSYGDTLTITITP